MPCQSPLQQITVAASKPSSAFLSNTMSQQQVSQHTPQLNSMAPNGGNGNQNNGLVTQSSQQQQQQVQQGSSQQPGGPGPKKVQNPRNQNGYNVKAMAAIKNDLNSYAKQPDHQAYQRPASVLSTGSSNSNGVFSDATIYKDIQTLMQNFSIDEEASRKLLMNTGGRVDLAVEYLQRLEGVQPYINNSVLTQSNVAAFHQYSNGHAHRASPALNAQQQQQQQRSESPSASGAPPLPPKPTMTDPRAPKVPPSVSHGGPTTNGVIDHPTLTRKYSPNNQQQQNGMNNHDVPPPLHPRRDANPNPPPTPPLPTRGTTPPPLPTQSSMVAQYSNSPGINTTLPALQRRMSPVPQVGGAYSRPQAGAIMVSSAVQRGTSPVTNGTPVRPHNTREAQTKVHQQLQAFSPNIFGPDNGTAEPPPPSYSQTLAAVNGNTNPPPPPPSYSQTMHMRQSPTLSSTSSVSDYSHINIRRSPAPGIGAPSNHSMMAVQGVPYGISQQQQMHHGPSPIPASPSPSISLMSGSSRASSSVQSRHIKTQSPVIMNQSSIVKSHQVQKPALQTATAVSKPIDGVAKPSMAKPLTKNIIMKPVPECSTPPLLNGAAGPGGGGPAPPPPSYENAIIQHKKLNSPTTVPRNISPAITSQQISSPVNPRLPSPPPYPSSQVEQMKQQLVKSQPVINTAKVKQTLQRKYSPLTNSETTSSSASRSESPISDSQQTTISSSENTVSCSPLSFQENTLTQDSGFDQFSSLQNQFSSMQLQQNNATALMPPPPAVPHKTTHHTSPKPERRSLISEVRRSYIKNCDPQAYKFFMEQHYDQTNGKVWNYYRERKQRKEDLIKELENLQKRPDSHPSGFNADQFLNAFFKMESKFLRHKRAKWKRNDFRTLKILGQGAFGSVSLVRNKNYEKAPNYSPNDSNGTMSKLAKQNKNLFAMKTLNKHNVRQKNQVGHVIAERDILSEANNDWIVKLQGSFQDKKNLYFIMEYVPGGDLMEKLIRDEKFDEDLARFYIAELTLAVESVHEMDFIHRDIKPDNILIDREGHLKLTDFGLCTGFRWTHRNEMYKDKLNDQVSTHFRQDSMDPGSLNLDAGQCSCKHTKPLERRRQRREQQQYRCMAHSMVGTPNYIAPEVLSARSTIPNSGVGYNQSCDWWSVGVIFYEMIVGRPPFLADDAKHTQIKILEWRKYLRILPEDNLSNEATNLIMGLINDSDKRLEAEQIKRHPFFNGLQFDGIRNRPAPWVPALANDEDTSHFNNFDSIRVNDSPDISDNDDIDDHYANHVAGFTFKRFQLNGGLDPAHFESSNNSSSGSSSQQQTHAPPDAVYV